MIALIHSVQILSKFETMRQIQKNTINIVFISAENTSDRVEKMWKIRKKYVPGYQAIRKKIQKSKHVHKFVRPEVC